MNFLKQSACEITGQPSSKRVTAYEFAQIGVIIVLTICFVIVYSVVKGIEIKPSISNAIYFLGGAVLVSVLGFVGTLFGLAMSQNKEAIKANIVTDLNQVLPAAEPQPQSETNG